MVTATTYRGSVEGVEGVERIAEFEERMTGIRFHSDTTLLESRKCNTGCGHLQEKVTE